MKRLLLSKLIHWKENIQRKPLILKGVRQCGKTHILKEFGEGYFSDTAYFNFEGNNALQERFKQDLDVERILIELGILRKKAITKDTLIIFDEIQFCNEALTSLKYFYENLPEYHVISAGSLLGIALSRPLSFPVGKVDMLTMYPLTFYEFLLANNEEMLCQYLDRQPLNEPISEMFLEKLESYLRTYYIVGGMPAVVKAWISSKNLIEVERIQKSILNNYELDFAKHAPKSDFPKLSLIWKSIPEQLAKENGKFMFGHVKKGLRAKDLEDALEWLISAGLVYKVKKISKPALPLSSYSDESFFKLYLADVGLLRTLAKLPAETLLSGNSTFKEFKGALTENYVLCELVALQEDAPFYWKSGNIAEVDFIIQIGVNIVPLEVKSEHNVRSKSLASYRKQYEPKIAIKLSMNNTSGDDVKNIPLYLIWRMLEI